MAANHEHCQSYTYIYTRVYRCAPCVYHCAPRVYHCVCTTVHPVCVPLCTPCVPLCTLCASFSPTGRVGEGWCHIMKPGAPSIESTVSYEAEDLYVGSKVDFN